MSFKDLPYRWLARMVTNDPEAFVTLGNAETRLLRHSLPQVVSPIYICGLARAGTTILTEVIATHREVATHTYRDFPLLFTPFFWNKTLGAFDWIPFKAKPRERAHRDGIMVTPKSPEAMEEVLWMAFFKRLHDESRSMVLTEGKKAKSFPAFYKEHIQKLLRARRRSRYGTKANYNLTRIGFILSIFPDARFVIVVRHPVPHVWSLHKKDRLFRAEQERNPQTLKHMNQVGHFEFGKGRVLINTGDDAAMASVKACFDASDDIRGWARYWAMIHRFIHERCEGRPEVLVMRHEDMCARPKEAMAKIYAHCRLDYTVADLDEAAAIFNATESSDIPQEAKAVICEETDAVSVHWGYTGEAV